MAEYIKLSELEKAVLTKQEEEKQYWFDWLKQFRATKEYPIKETAVDNFLRGYGEAVQYILSVNKPLLLKSADVTEVVHSKWMLYTDGSGECERCRMRQKNVWDFDGWQNFCGYCGAKMDGKGKDGEENGL